MPPKKNAGKKRSGKGKRKGRAKKPSGYLKTIRWSNRDTTNNCHFNLPGIATGVYSLTTTFNLSDLAGSGELKSLFDNYRIIKVIYRWVLRRDPDYTTVSPGSNVRVMWVHDFNDQIAISSNQMRQNANCKEVILSDNRYHTKWYTLNPASLVTNYISSVSSAYLPKWKQWTDTTYDTMPHYGIKYNIEQLYTGTNLQFECKYIVECKGVS